MISTKRDLWAQEPIPDKFGEYTVYRVKEGDCISVIAERELGDVGFTQQIIDMNADQIFAQQRAFSVPISQLTRDTIYPGQQLKLPWKLRRNDQVDWVVFTQQLERSYHQYRENLPDAPVTMTSILNVLVLAFKAGLAK